jgi:hypothetical protein
MQRRNGMALRVQSITAAAPDDVGGRIACRDCGRLVPRGSDRPYCLDHAAYAQALIRAMESLDIELETVGPRRISA